MVRMESRFYLKVNTKKLIDFTRPGGDEGQKGAKMRRRGGMTFENGHHKYIACVVTGEMTDGTKVWTECDKDKNLINIDKQYTLQTKGNWSEFIPL